VLLRGWSCCLMEKARRLRLFLLPAVASGGARDGQVSAGGGLLPRAIEKTALEDELAVPSRRETDSSCLHRPSRLPVACSSPLPRSAKSSTWQSRPRGTSLAPMAHLAS
jgi:hypothetical protein